MFILVFLSGFHIYLWPLTTPSILVRPNKLFFVINQKLLHIHFLSYFSFFKTPLGEQSYQNTIKQTVGQPFRVHLYSDILKLTKDAIVRRQLLRIFMFTYSFAQMFAYIAIFHSIISHRTFPGFPYSNKE